MRDYKLTMTKNGAEVGLDMRHYDGNGPGEAPAPEMDALMSGFRDTATALGWDATLLLKVSSVETIPL